ncbi:TRP domain-containing protein [Trichoderma aethiopicum]
MWFSSRSVSLLFAATAALLSPVSAEKMLVSTSLNTCQENSGLQASFFNVVFTPNNNSATIQLVATSSVQGYVMFDIEASAYGYTFLKTQLDPCKIKLAGMCPMTAAAKFNIPFNIPVSASAASQIPSIAYSVPDLDASVRVRINLTSTGESIACVQADISNGKTVNLVGVKWATAIIAGIALVSSAVFNGLGHSNTAAHVAALSLSLFGYFQAQAMIGLTGVGLPPIVQAWTQNFQWSMGIIHVGFMQTIFTWYQRATGGTPASLFSSLGSVSVTVEKRGLDAGLDAGLAMGRAIVKRSLALMPKAAANIVRRSGNILSPSGGYVVYGIQRVAFSAKIETTNLFITGLTFFWLFAIFTMLGVTLFKALCEGLVKQGVMKSDRFLEFRNGWRTVLKGILYRIALIGLPQLSILCFWEFTQADSAAEIVLAVFYFFCPLIALCWGASKVIKIARRSIDMHGNPAYILFSDPQALNKWGFLYVQFRASAYYFIGPILVYTLIKAMFVAFAQKTSVAQAIGFMILEVGMLIATSVLRPWMDKKTNSFNIAIYVINFLNSVFLLIFTNVFGAPLLAIGVVGVILFVLNAIFSLVLLLMVIASTAYSIYRKNPDARYQFMADDRASFMKSQTQLNNNAATELDALAVTARGDKAGYKLGDDEEASITSNEQRHPADATSSMAYAPQSMTAQPSFYQPARSVSPVNPSVPLFPANDQQSHSSYGHAPPSPSGMRHSPSFGSNSNTSPGGYRSQNNASPWQRGAGYD